MKIIIKNDFGAVKFIRQEREVINKEKIVSNDFLKK